ncbi:MAG: hypothetical protein E7293_07200 [Lachnospiraceae bacterium]|nr:hypothetical protein [Lachnospiraceae bacterium]
MLKVGFYEKEITPPLGCDIPGYYSKRVSDGVVDKLYIKAVAISDGKETVVMAAADACGMDLGVHDEILKRASEYTGISSDHMSLSATHTHTGIPRKGLPGAPVQGDDAFDEYFIRIGADCITLAVQSMQEAKVKFGKGYVDSISFNRVYNMADGRIQTAPEIGDPEVLGPHGPIDPELTVLYAEDMQGKPMGAIVNFACHPDVIKGTKYSGDWPSVVSYGMKDAYGRDFVSLFVNGTCGNINHVDVMGATEYPPSSHYIKMGKIVAAEAIKAISQAQEVQGDTVASNKVYLKMPERDWDMEKINNAKHIVATIKPIEGLTLALGTGNQEQEDLMVAQQLLRAYDARQEYRMVGVQAARVGDCYLYAVPGEMYVQFGLYVKEHSPSDKNIVAELSHGYSGYIPLKDLMYDTVYESRRTTFVLQPGAGELIAETAAKLAAELAWIRTLKGLER